MSNRKRDAIRQAHMFHVVERWILGVCVVIAILYLLSQGAA